MIITLDNIKVVVCNLNGEIVEPGEGFLNLLRNEIYDITSYKREIVFSKLKNKSGIYGAIRNGLNYLENAIYENPGLFYKFVKLNISNRIIY